MSLIGDQVNTLEMRWHESQRVRKDFTKLYDLPDSSDAEMDLP
jgi:hypothetical protein